MAQLIRLNRLSKLDWYVRPGRSGSGRLAQLISQNRTPCDGVVLDPTLWSRQSELASIAQGAGIETILDPRSLELSSAGGLERPGISQLPWCTRPAHTAQALGDVDARRRLVGPIAEFAVQNSLSAVLAPTHFVETSDDPWLDIDDLLTVELRHELDRRGGGDILVHRPLYVHSKLFRQLGSIEKLSSRLRTTHFAQLWLAVHPFGTMSSGSIALKRYIEACRILGAVEVPLVAMRTGTVGLLLMAIGAVSAMECGITDGEGFDITHHTTPPRPPENGKPVIGSTPRIYIASLGVFMTTREADAFFGVRGMKPRHLCQTGCCPRGYVDIVKKRVDHFLLSRKAEIARLSAIPPRLRGKIYLDEFLRPASDRAVAASRAHVRIPKVRVRLDDWRQTVSAILEDQQAVAQPATTRVVEPNQRPAVGSLVPIRGDKE